jgi:hypothetical protein
MTNVIDNIQKKIESKKLDAKIRFQLVENISMSTHEWHVRRGMQSRDDERRLTIERIFPLDNGEMLDKRRFIDVDQQRLSESSGENVASKQFQRFTCNDFRLYGCSELEDDNRISHFIYCIMPEKISENMTICVLSLSQKVIDRKDTSPRYEYASSLLYMKLPFYKRVGNVDTSDNEYDMNGEIEPLSIDTKKKIIHLVEDRNQCFNNTHNNIFYEGQLMDRPIKLPNGYRAHVLVHQSVAPPYLLSISLQDEFNVLVSSITCICAISYANLICLH